MGLGDRTLTVTAAEMGGMDGRFLNTAWMSMFFEPLNATGRDWMKIQAFWSDPALRGIHETEEITEAESIIERLRAHLGEVTMVATSKEMTTDQYGWLDGAGRVWVRNSLIARFIDQGLKRPAGYSSALSKLLRTAGHMPAPSKKMRVGKSSHLVWVWGFNRKFAWGEAVPTPAPLSVLDGVEAAHRRGGE